MITLADCSHHLKRHLTSLIADHGGSLRNGAFLIVLASLLAGCIQPDAPLPGTPATTVTAPPTAVSAAVASTPLMLATAAPTLSGGSAPITVTMGSTADQASAASGFTDYPSAPDRVWKLVPVGAEQVAVLFYHDSANNRCIRYIFRSKALAKCATAGQTLVAIAANEKTADGKTYAVVVGRALVSQITAVSIEMRAGTNTSAQIDDQGFSAISEGAQTPIRVTPIDQNGNQVGGQFSF